MGQSCTKEPTTSRLKSVDAEASRKRVRRTAKGSQRRDSTAKPTATDTGAMNCLESPPDSSEEVSAEPVVEGRIRREATDANHTDADGIGSTSTDASPESSPRAGFEHVDVTHEGNPLELR